MRAFVVLLSVSVLALACGPSSEPAQEGTEIAESASSEIAPAACLAEGERCDEPGGACCAGTRCIEYTVYDYPRCRVPEPKGAFCWRHDQCASGFCGSGNACE